MPPSKTKLRQAGFTLIELLITITLTGILSISLVAFVANWTNEYLLAQKRADLLNNAETALDTVGNDIRLSGEADLNNRWPDSNAPSAPANLFSWQSNSQTIVLAKAAIDSNKNVLYSDPNKYITEKDNDIYYLSGTTLYRRILASDNAADSAVTTCPPPGSGNCPPDKTIATGVSSLSAQYYDASENIVTPTSARSVQLNITMNSTSNGHTISASYNTRMVFRNK